MSTSRLREAATKLREVAGGATEPPWVSAREAGMGHVIEADRSWVCVLGNEEGNEEDAAYIATMSPPVALALADWLDKTADLSERHGIAWTLGDALAVADAILGPTK